MSRFTFLAITFAPIIAFAEPEEVPQPAAAPPGCKAIVAIARPIAAPQYHDPTLQQPAGTLALRIDHGEVKHGTVVATVVGKASDGSLLGNHDALFADVGFRTRGDRIVAKPTSDKCVLDVMTTLEVVDGRGALAHLRGTLSGIGQIDVCGAEGRVAIRGNLCPAQ
jgi:hypothetical protein